MKNFPLPSILLAVSAAFSGLPAGAETLSRFDLQLERSLPRPALPLDHEWRALNGTDIASLTPWTGLWKDERTGPSLTLRDCAKADTASHGEAQRLALLEAWLASLAARDDLWLARVRQTWTVQEDGTPPADDEMAQQVHRARQALRFRLNELEAIAGPLGPRTLPFIRPLDLVLRDPDDSTHTRSLLENALGRIEAARNRLAAAVGARTGMGSDQAVGAAMIQLVEEWRMTYRIAYSHVMRQARQDARSLGLAAVRLPDELFSGEPPRF